MWLVAFWCGASVMAFELLGARLLMPSYGMGIDVWTAVITTTLAALAVGYWLGGRIADARPSPVTLAVILFVVGLSIVVIRLMGRMVPMLFQNTSLLVGAWGSALAILVPTLTFLGMVPPLLARLMVEATERAGKTFGGVMAAGTVGSMVGTILAGIVLIPHVGVSGTLLGLACATLAFSVAALGVSRRFRSTILALVFALAAAGPSWAMDPWEPKVGEDPILEKVEGLYGNLEVIEHRGSLALVANGIFQTALPQMSLGLWPGDMIRGREYTELIPFFRPEAESALLIGLGGGLYERALGYYGIDVRAVEIEPEVVRLADEYFGYWGDATVMDGRAFLARDPGRYDAVVVDAFLGGSLPEHLFTREAFGEMRERLEPGGVIVLHMFGSPGHPAIRAVARTLEAAFRGVRAVRSGYFDEFQQIYLFGSQEPLELSDRLTLSEYGFTGDEFVEIETASAPVLTDDRTNLGVLSRDIVAEFRLRSLAERRRGPWQSEPGS
jgi:predicted membrane-bound spermidine synthase